MRGIINQGLSAFGYEIIKRPLHKVSNNSVVFLHIGKNAGTQIGHLAQQINSQSKRKIIKRGHSVKLEHLREGQDYFFSIRDPLKRFKSAFYSRKRKGRANVNNEWIDSERMAFEAFEHANDLAEALFAEGKLGQHALGAMQSIGHVCNRQLDWFGRSGYFLEGRPPLWIIRQESLEADFDRLLSRGGFDVQMKDLSLAQDSLGAHSFDYGGIPELSETASENLRIWYAADVDFCKHCENWIRDNQ